MEVQWDLWSGTQQQVEAASAAATIVARTATGRIENDAHIADGFLHYEVDYQVLICKEHGYALRSLTMHLRDQHSIPAKARRAIVAKYTRFSLSDPKEISLLTKLCRHSDRVEANQKYRRHSSPLCAVAARKRIQRAFRKQSMPDISQSPIPTTNRSSRWLWNQ